MTLTSKCSLQFGGADVKDPSSSKSNNLSFYFRTSEVLLYIYIPKTMDLPIKTPYVKWTPCHNLVKCIFLLYSETFTLTHSSP